jgi:acyl carrier protein
MGKQWFNLKRRKKMTNYEKYVKAFTESLEVTEEQLEGLTYQGIDSWDSVGHMSLVAAIEEAFDIMMDTDDIIDFSSFEKGKEILSAHYEIEF